MNFSKKNKPVGYKTKLFFLTLSASYKVYLHKKRWHTAPQWDLMVNSALEEQKICWDLCIWERDTVPFCLHLTWKISLSTLKMTFAYTTNKLLFTNFKLEKKKSGTRP